MNLSVEIEEDLKRSEQALESAERNFGEGDVLTAANRAFVACESIIYAFLKLQYGSISISRERILTRLKEVDSSLKELYDQSYDLRVQADYGKQSRLLPLNQANVENILSRTKDKISVIKEKINQKIAETKK